MKCFKHSQLDAVGVCKHCYKAVCPECTIDTGYGVACSPQCQEELTVVKALIERNKNVQAATAKAYGRNITWLFLFAVLFVTFGLIERKDFSFSIFLIVMGALFCIGAVFSLLTSRSVLKRG